MSYLIFVQNHFNFDKRAFHIHLCYNADSILIILFKILWFALLDNNLLDYRTLAVQGTLFSIIY